MSKIILNISMLSAVITAIVFIGMVTPISADTQDATRPISDFVNNQGKCFIPPGDNNGISDNKQAIPVPTGCSGRGGEWNQLINNYQNSRFQQSSIINSNNVGNITLAWVYHSGSSITSTPIVDNGSVYVEDVGGNVSSLKITDGSLLWKVKLGTFFTGTPSVIGGLVFVAGNGLSGRPEVFSLSPVDGHTIWATPLNTTMDNIWASPIIYNGLLYIGTAGCNDEINASCKGEVFALNANNGKVVWSFITAGPAGGAGVWGSVAIDPKLNQIYFGTGNQYANGSNGYAYSIVSLDATTGVLKWYYQIYKTYAEAHPEGYGKQDLDFGSTPNLFGVYINGVFHNAVGLGSKNGRYYIWDRESGVLLGNFRILSGEIIGIAGFIGRINPTIFIPGMPLTNSDESKSPLNYGLVVALNPATGIKWNFTTNSLLVGSVAEIPGAVIFGDSTGNLYAVSSKTGTQLFKTTLPGGIYAGVTPAEGHIIVTTVGNQSSLDFLARTGGGVYAYVLKPYRPQLPRLHNLPPRHRTRSL